MRVLLIIPAYNEELNIYNTIKKVKKYQKKSLNLIDYIVINDGSKDGTLNILEENKYNYINLVQNLGIGGAVQTGYKYAYYNDYDIAIQFDGDGQHDINYVDKLVENINLGNDLVIGSRFISDLSKFKSTKLRRIGIKVLSFVIRICTGYKIYDPTSGFRACNRRVIKQFAFNYPREYPEPETDAILLQKKYRIAEIPVEMYERENGKSSINFWKSIYYMVSVTLAILLSFLSGGSEL